ncbi:MAG: Bug family tripartite tricarboxylate transporter substrate binding protein [Xanthobacteraceae bacterium]
MHGERFLDNSGFPLSRRSLVAGLACSGAFGSLAGKARAAVVYPVKPVRVIVPYGPGGVGDLTMRLLADQLSRQLKQQFVIENRPGAGGIVAMTEVLKAPADGYTLGEMGNGQSISVSLFNHLPYDVLKDFTQISVAASFEMLLAAPDKSPYKTVADIVAAARKSPGKLNLGAINPGSTQNLSAHLFEQVTGAEYTIVPYRTTPDLVTALLRGDVDLGFDFYAALKPMIAPGKVRIIATSGEQRDPLLPDVPTVKESGFPSYIVTSWNGLGVRTGTPVEIVNLLSVAINQALAAPGIQQKSRMLGIDARGSTPAQMHERMVQEVAKWRDVIEKAHIPKE